MKNSVKALLLACMLCLTIGGLIWAGGAAEALESYDYLRAAEILQRAVGLIDKEGEPADAAAILAGEKVSDSDAVPQTAVPVVETASGS